MINYSVGKPEKGFGINFTKKIKFCVTLHYNTDESYLFVNKTRICKFKGFLQFNSFFVFQKTYLKILEILN